MNIQPSMKIKVLANTEDEQEKLIIAENKSVIVNLDTLESFYFCDAESIPSSCATCVTGNTTCFVSLEGVIDFEKEIKRLEKELEKNTKELLGVQKRLNNESFLDKAPSGSIFLIRLIKGFQLSITPVSKNNVRVIVVIPSLPDLDLCSVVAFVSKKLR